MAKYDFQTINDKEFEELCKDLLNKKFNFSLQSFKKGKDKGIDLRVSTPDNTNEIVVQAKHYFASGYKSLLRTLGSEVDKVKNINPGRYILVTSLPLTPSNQTEIKNLFSPYIKSESDVIGNETLNDLLAEFPEIERNNFKLWMSSIQFIENILQRGVFGRSNFYSEEIKSNISLYVPNSNLPNALKLLRDKKALIISGEPGIGKSTLADMVCLRLLADKYNLYKIDDIKEAEDVFSPSLDKKQLFYLDDFLGQIYLEYTLSGNHADSRIKSFIQRVRTTPNKLVIFTTRTVILNQALSIYEKFKSIFSQTENIELQLTDYTKYQKGLILYNHLYYRSLRPELLNILYTDDLFMKVINHKNYNPRIIDFISDSDRVGNLTVSEYKQLVTDSLNNPSDIWEISFYKQINNEQRFLLLSLFTFKDNAAEEESLQEAYKARIAYEIKCNGHTRSTNSFVNSLKILLNGFISRRLTLNVSRDTSCVVSYINPSLGDYLRNYLLHSKEERIRLISSFIYLEQFDKLNGAISGVIRTSDEYQVSSSIIINNPSLKSLALNTSDFDITIKKTKCLLEIVQGENQYTEIRDLFVGGKWDFVRNAMTEFVFILKNSKRAPSLYRHIHDHFSTIITFFIEQIDDFEDHSTLKSIFIYYGKDFTAFIKIRENGLLVSSIFQSLFDTHKEKQVYELEKTILEESQHRELKEKLEEIANNLDESLFEGSDFRINVDFDNDWGQYIQANNENYHEPDYDDDEYHFRRKEEQDEDAAIRDLFDRH